jgi:hypothetical protein
MLPSRKPGTPADPRLWLGCGDSGGIAAVGNDNLVPPIRDYGTGMTEWDVFPLSGWEQKGIAIAKPGTASLPSRFNSPAADNIIFSKIL